MDKPPFPATENEARDQAITWSAWVSEQNLSYGELAEWQGYFETVAERFPDLTDEFKENGIL